MSISFKCESCRRTVEAPGEAAGKRGECPYCGHSNVVPSPPAPEGEDRTIPLAPLDEEEEARRRREAEELIEKEKALLEDDAGKQDIPTDQREDLTSEDLHHHVVNYCLDMAGSNLERTPTHVQKLKRYGEVGRQAVDDFLMQRALEPALKDIPPRLLHGFLKQLRNELGE